MRDDPARPKAKPILTRYLYLIPAVIVAALLALAITRGIFDADRKVYTRGEFESVMRGKTEAEIAALLGPPQEVGQEPWNSPQADKRFVAYYADGSRWSIAGEDGAVVIWFSVGKNHADYFMYVPRPPSGRSITIRW